MRPELAPFEFSRNCEAVPICNMLMRCFQRYLNFAYESDSSSAPGGFRNAHMQHCGVSSSR